MDLNINLFKPDFSNRFNDKRLEKRGLQIVELLTMNANVSIRRISPDIRTQKAVYRFLNNEKVKEDGLIEELCIRSAKNCHQRHVLCIQDTTEMNYYSQRHRIKDETGLGRLDCAKAALGFKMHSTLIIDANNSDILGFSNLQLWHRPLDMPNRKERHYQSLPIEDKESYKWIKAADKSRELLADAALITIVEDREGDIYEQLSSIHSDEVHYVIRSKSNRNNNNNTKIWDTLSKQPDIGSYQINLSTDHRKNRKKDEITLKVRFAKVTITKGSHIKNGVKYPKQVTINIVEAYEEKEDGINWKLLTTHSINNFEEAYQIIEWYSQRWLIEQVHRLLKSKGFQIEDSELESGWAIRKLCILMLSALLRIFQMNMAYNDPEEGQPIEEVFTNDEIECLKAINKEVEGKNEKLKNNNNPAKLKWATWIIARLGGWSGYISQGPPGIILLKRGSDKFADILRGWKLVKDVGTR